MSYNRNEDGCTTIGCLGGIIVFIIQLGYGLFIENKLHHNIFFAYSIATSTTLFALYYGILNIKRKKELDKLKIEHSQKEYTLKKEYSEKEKKLISEKDLYKLQIEKMVTLMGSKEPFSLSASLFSDMKSYIFDDAAKFLIRKKYPAYTTANEIKNEMKKLYVESQKEYKTLLYKVEFLLDIFPDLKSFMEDDQSIKELTVYKDYKDIIENKDKSRDYLTPQEWNNLDSVQRNQLALDRWSKSDKSKLVIGLLYEMYISHILRTNGHKVIEHGIKNGVSDLGRDIISYKNGWVFIYQCKNWGKNKFIHENVVCQLFGTVMEYKIKHMTENVKAILVVSTKLTPMAEEFSKRLGIEVRKIDLGEFPMIKCNINGNNRIYHLPFDQQYWRTEINKPGEFYAKTVLEAESKGFRRAMKYSFLK